MVYKIAFTLVGAILFLAAGNVSAGGLITNGAFSDGTNYWQQLGEPPSTVTTSSDDFTDSPFALWPAYAGAAIYQTFTVPTAGSLTLSFVVSDDSQGWVSLQHQTTAAYQAFNFSACSGSYAPGWTNCTFTTAWEDGPTTITFAATNSHQNRLDNVTVTLGPLSAPPKLLPTPQPPVEGRENPLIGLQGDMLAGGDPEEGGGLFAGLFSDGDNYAFPQPYEIANIGEVWGEDFNNLQNPLWEAASILQFFRSFLTFWAALASIWFVQLFVVMGGIAIAITFVISFVNRRTEAHDV